MAQSTSTSHTLFLLFSPSGSETTEIFLFKLKVSVESPRDQIKKRPGSNKSRFYESVKFRLAFTSSHRLSASKAAAAAATKLPGKPTCLIPALTRKRRAPPRSPPCVSGVAVWTGDGVGPCLSLSGTLSECCCCCCCCRRRACPPRCCGTSRTTHTKSSCIKLEKRSRDQPGCSTISQNKSADSISGKNKSMETFPRSSRSNQEL